MDKELYKNIVDGDAKGVILSEGIKKEAIDKVDTKDSKDTEDGEDIGKEVDTDEIKKESYTENEQPAVKDGKDPVKVVPGKKSKSNPDTSKIAGTDPTSVVPGGKVAKESVEQMFEGAETLSPEFMNKAEVIFEAAYTSRVAEITESLTESLTAEFDANYESLEEELTDKVDKYLEYVLNEWIEDNKVAVHNGLKQEIAEDFLTDFKTLLESHNITISDDKVDLYEESQKELDETKSQLNSLMKESMSHKATIFDFEKSKVINTLAEGLTETQVDKLKTLVEGIEAKDVETFESKTKIIKESMFTGSKTTSTCDQLNEANIVKTKNAVTSNHMSSYMKHAKLHNNK